MTGEGVEKSEATTHILFVCFKFQNSFKKNLCCTDENFSQLTIQRDYSLVCNVTNFIDASNKSKHLRGHILSQKVCQIESTNILYKIHTRLSVVL